MGQTERQRRYNNSEKGRAAQAKYRKSEKGKVATARNNKKICLHAKTVEGKAVRAKYRSSDRGKAAQSRYWAKRRGALIGGDGVPAERWAQIKAGFSQHCVYCLKLCDNLEQDHVVPLSSGGLHDSTNIVPACKSCNSKKGNRDAELGAYIK